MNREVSHPFHRWTQLLKSAWLLKERPVLSSRPVTAWTNARFLLKEKPASDLETFEALTLIKCKCLREKHASTVFPEVKPEAHGPGKESPR